MLKFLKKRWLWIVLVIIVVGGVYYWFSTNQPPAVEYSTELVKQGELIQSVSATGEVESANNINLNFKTTGKLSYLDVDEGDKVTSGQILARLDSAGLSALVQQYRANLYSAQADLERVLAGASAEDVALVEERVMKAENDLNSLLREQTNDLALYQDKLMDSLNNASFIGGVAVEIVYDYLINDDTTTGLITSNVNLRNQVEHNYYVVSKALSLVKQSFSDLSGEETQAEVISLADDFSLVLSDINLWLDNTYSLADHIVANNYYSETDKSTIKSAIASQQSSVNTALSSLQTAKSNLANAISSYETSIEAAEDNLAIYRAELNSTTADPRGFEIKSAQAKVDQAQAQLNKALADLTDYTITSPIDGVVTRVNFDLGEQTNMSEPVVQVLSLEQFEVKLDIPESDITKLEIGDQVVIELDAFGSDHQFNGTVSFIDPAQTVISDVVYYKTTISFNEDSWNQQIKPGMTADVTVITAQKSAVLYIPQRAVRLKEASLGEVPEKYVEVLVGEDQVEERTVEIGLRADGGLVEIISGLEPGESVVTFKKDNTK